MPLGRGFTKTPSLSGCLGRWVLLLGGWVLLAVCSCSDVSDTSSVDDHHSTQRALSPLHTTPAARGAHPSRRTRQPRTPSPRRSPLQPNLLPPNPPCPAPSTVTPGPSARPGASRPSSPTRPCSGMSSCVGAGRLWTPFGGCACGRRRGEDMCRASPEQHANRGRRIAAWRWHFVWATHKHEHDKHTHKVLLYRSRRRCLRR